jgi:hypothetical protein
MDHAVVLMAGPLLASSSAAISWVKALTIAAEFGSNGASADNGAFQKLVGEKKRNGAAGSGLLALPDELGGDDPAAPSEPEVEPDVPSELEAPSGEDPAAPSEPEVPSGGEPAAPSEPEVPSRDDPTLPSSEPDGTSEPEPPSVDPLDPPDEEEPSSGPGGTTGFEAPSGEPAPPADGEEPSGARPAGEGASWTDGSTLPGSPGCRGTGAGGDEPSPPFDGFLFGLEHFCPDARRPPPRPPR